jgi:replicative DNA helicase
VSALVAIEQPAIANAESEAALCGALMQENALIDQIADGLSPEDFSDQLFGRIFAAIVQERSLGRHANPVTLKRYFLDDPAMAELGGPSFLAQLTGSLIVGAKDFAWTIRDLSQKRKLVEGLTEAIRAARMTEASVDEVAAMAEATLAASSDAKEASSQSTAAQALGKLVAGLNDHERGVFCGIAPIDAQLGPILPKQLVILAGRPAMGKSSVASTYALSAAAKGHGTLFVSLEMSEEELSERIACDLCFDGPVQVPYSAVTGRCVTTEQYRAISRAGEMIERLPLRIEDRASITLSRLNATVRRTKRRMAADNQKLELVIVDYLQLVRSDRKNVDRYEEVSEVSRGLKALAKEHGVGVLALAQLSRNVEQRHDKRPIMADLRDSGQIEQDADAIMFLFRPEYYLQQEEPGEADSRRADWEAKMAENAGQIEFIVAKRRRGRTGTSFGRYYGAFQAVRGVE